MTFCAADAMFSAPHPGSPEWQYGVLLDPRKDLVTCLGVGLSVPGAQVLTHLSFQWLLLSFAEVQAGLFLLQVVLLLSCFF